MTEGWVEYLNGPWGLAFALAAGLLSFLSPCCLPLVPAYLAHLTGTTATLEPGRSMRREAIMHAFAYVMGFTVLFTLIGASVGLLGAFLGGESSYLVRDQIPLLQKIGGVALVVMGLNLMGVIRVPFLYRSYSLEPQFAAVSPPVTSGGAAALTLGGYHSPWRPLGYGKSFVLGSAFAVGWTPCIGPVLGTILTLSATSGDAVQGSYLLLVYSVGLGVPFILTALAVAPATRLMRRMGRTLFLVEIAMGAMIVLFGALLFLDELATFNRYFVDVPFLRDLYGI